MISQETIDKVFETANIEDIVGDFINLKKTGANYKGLSPFTDEKTPSFVVSPAKQIWKDFSSGKGGTFIGFLMEHAHMTYPESIKYVAKKYNIDIIETITNEKKLEEKSHIQQLYNINQEFKNIFKKNLFINEETLNYLKTRGFDEKIIEKFDIGLGLNQNEQDFNKLKEKGLKIELIKELGLVIKNKNNLYNKFNNRIIFPIHDGFGKISGFAGRIKKTSNNAAKYINSQESLIYKKSEILYGYYFAKNEISKNQNCYIVEGYTDVISLDQSGIKNVVACSGTALTEKQKNWIGKSQGVSILFKIYKNQNKIEVFTTRPDTIFGATFLVLCPEHNMIDEIVTKEQKNLIYSYINKTSLKSERDRQSDIKNITGEFTGAYAIHPFTGVKIPIWISDYVLSGYGSGAIMAVPCGDQRDWEFAKNFNLKILNIFKDTCIKNGAYVGDEAKIINSDFLNGKSKEEAISKSITFIQNKGIGEKQINYRIRDAVFSRQRYWGEPFPVYYKNNIPYLIETNKALELPVINKYLPTKQGEPPLARAKKSDWNMFFGDKMDYNTMPGWAGSSWYFIRYMDPNNDKEFVSKNKLDYWNQVDIYIGGAEHAVGHLLYSRFWTKFLFDRGFLPFKEPFKKMINQGMILGRSNIIYRVKGENKFITKERQKDYETISLNVDINIVNNDILDLDLFKKWKPEFKNAEFILNKNNEYKCGVEVEKMSKSKFNVQNPDELVEEYGADSLRLYEMFLGPITQSKPWNKSGISGCYNFLNKYWNFLHKKEKFFVSEEKLEKEDLKILHSTIKKVKNDIESFSFNTAISSLMICLNYMHDNNILKREMVEKFNLLLSPFAPHITEEIWSKLDYPSSVVSANFPSYNEKYMIKNNYDYPISFNGKVKFKINLSTDLNIRDIKKIVLSDERTINKISDFKIKKVIIIPEKIVNIVF